MHWVSQTGCRRETGLFHPSPFLTATHPAGRSSAAACCGALQWGGGLVPSCPHVRGPSVSLQEGSRAPASPCLLLAGHEDVTCAPILPLVRLRARRSPGDVQPSSLSRAGLVLPTRGTATQTRILRGQPQPQSPPSCGIAHPASPEAPAPRRGAHPAPAPFGAPPATAPGCNPTSPQAGMRTDSRADSWLSGSLSPRAASRPCPQLLLLFPPLRQGNGPGRFPHAGGRQRRGPCPEQHRRAAPWQGRARSWHAPSAASQRGRTRTRGAGTPRQPPVLGSRRQPEHPRSLRPPPRRAAPSARAGPAGGPETGRAPLPRPHRG